MLGFDVDELVLEFANREMAEVEILGEIAAAGRDVAAGVVDVKNYYIETAEDVAERIDAVLAAGVPAERLTLVPDCGFSQTARWATLAKLRALVAGRDLVRRPARPEGGTRGGPPHLDARHRADRRLLHEDAPRPARPRPGPGRLLAERGARQRVQGALGRSRRRRPTWRPPSNHPDTDVVIVGRAELPARGGGQPRRPGGQGRAVHEAARAGTAEEAKRMLEAVESAGRLRAATSRTSATRPRPSRRSRRSRAGRSANVTWVRSRETHPGPALGVVLGRPADRRRRDHRPRLPLHRDHPQLRRQGEPAGRGHVPHRHARPPDQPTRTTRSR